MSQTGYGSNNFMTNPAYMIDLRISPNAVPDINQIARQSKVTPEQVIDSYVNSGFSFSEMAVEESIQTGNHKINICYFENCPLAVSISVKHGEISSIILARYEADKIEGAMQIGASYVDLDWINITFENVEIVNDESYS